MLSTIKFAIIGFGHIGKRHAEVIAKHPLCELVAVADVKTPAEVEFSDKNIPFYQSFNDFITSKSDCDVVIISTPNGLHYEMAKAVLEFGRHVVIEKPMALCAKQAAELVELAEERQRQIFSVMQNRYSPPSVWLKYLMDQNILGEIYFVQVNCFWNRDARYYTPDSWHGDAVLDGGTLYTQFSHFLDIMLWLFGSISNIEARFADFNHSGLTDFEDSGFILFDFLRGGKGNFNYSTAVWDCNLESSITIIAENGSVKVGGQYMDKIETCHIKNYEMPVLPATNPSNCYLHYKGSASNHQYLVDNVVNVLKGSAEITVKPADSIRLIETISEIYSQRTEDFLKI